jgi:hypothetical protein
MMAFFIFLIICFLEIVSTMVTRGEKMTWSEKIAGQKMYSRIIVALCLFAASPVRPDDSLGKIFLNIFLISIF